MAMQWLEKHLDHYPEYQRYAEAAKAVQDSKKEPVQPRTQYQGTQFAKDHDYDGMTLMQRLNAKLDLF